MKGPKPQESPLSFSQTLEFWFLSDFYPTRISNSLGGWDMMFSGAEHSQKTHNGQHILPSRRYTSSGPI